MQLHILFNLNLFWLLLPQAKGGNWTITITERQIKAMQGETVTINCSFTYPKDQHTDDVKLYWKINGNSSCSQNDMDKNDFVFHPDHKCINSIFSNRTKLIGNKKDGNCSLQILHITQNVENIYLRVSGLSNNYSFKKDNVSISIGSLKSTVAYFNDSTFSSTVSYSNTVHNGGNLNLYLVILVPVLGIMCIVVVATAIYRYRKRSNTFTREESGYYVNFKQTSSHMPESEPPCETSNKLPPDSKVIDEPVYINYQTSGNQMGQRAEHMDNIYGNVDYT